MLKQLLAFSCLTLSVGVSAAILDLGVITRDTATGLDWLDVTETRGLSYNQVTAELSIGGAYEGYRYAVASELDQLIINFGYVAVTKNCAFSVLHCDRTPLSRDQDLIVDDIIRSLGDTRDAYHDEVGDFYDTDPLGFAATFGILGSQSTSVGLFDMGSIIDDDFVFRFHPGTNIDNLDSVQTVHLALPADDQRGFSGSFLVSPSPVPLPAAAWLFGSALLGLGAIKHRKT